MSWIGDLVWQCWIFPAALFVGWVSLWVLGRRRVRLWFAGLSLLGPVLTFIVGVLLLGSGSGNSSSCPGPGACGSGDGMYLAQSLASISEVAVVTCINAVLAFILAVPLSAVTVMIDLPKPERDRSRSL